MGDCLLLPFLTLSPPFSFPPLPFLVLLLYFLPFSSLSIAPLLSLPHLLLTLLPTPFTQVFPT